MAYTQADIDALKRAMATGVRRVTYADGRSHEFFSMAEMNAQLQRMEKDVASSSGAGDGSRSVVLTHQREW